MKLVSFVLTLSSFLSAVSVNSVHADGIASGEGKKPYGYKENDPSMYGPSQWGTQYPTCAGKRQSPIDIAPSLKGCGVKLPLKFSGSCSEYKLSKLDDTYKGEVKGGSCSVSTNGDSYSMLQFHIHAPSEHTLNGKVYDGEAHFVHTNPDSSALLVVGVFLEKMTNAKTDPWIASAIKAIGAVNATAPSNITLGSYSKVLTGAASEGRTFNYPGSLTTPVCSEIVDWWVLQKPVQISSADFDKFMGYLKMLPATDEGLSARPVQPLNGRTIAVY